MTFSSLARAGLLAALLLAAAPVAARMPPPAAAAARAAMVERISRRIAGAYPKLAGDPHLAAVLAATASVDRAAFVPRRDRDRAYADVPLPIGHGQTISDAYIVALMTAALALPPDSRVLEVGTGSGYQAAILSRLAAHVNSIEIVAPLAAAAARRLRRLGFANVAIRAGDGFAGWPEAAPFDGILVTAGAAAVPPPLLAQLRPGGRLVMPIGPQWALEQLIVFTKRADGGVDRCTLGSALFVPLTGRGRRTARSIGLYDRSLPDCY